MVNSLTGGSLPLMRDFGSRPDPAHLLKGFTMSIVIVSLSLLVFGWSVSGLVNPKIVKLPNRLVAGGVLLLSFALLFVGFNYGSPENPDVPEIVVEDVPGDVPGGTEDTEDSSTVEGAIVLEWVENESLGVFADRLPGDVTAEIVDRTDADRNIRYTIPNRGSIMVEAIPCEDGIGLCVIDAQVE